MKNLLPLFGILLTLGIGCGSNAATSENQESSTAPGKVSTAEQQSDLLKNKGIGPISSVEMGEIDQAMAEEGQKLYNSMCTACHKVGEDYIGPTPTGIFERRSPEWVMNMILNPAEMLQKDPIAKKLLEDYNNIPMANQGLSQEEARSILEYFRTL